MNRHIQINKTNRINRKGQEKILVDLVSFIVFLIAIIIFLVIFNVKEAAEQERMKTSMAVADNHLKLLEFLKSDYGESTVAEFLANADSEKDEAEIEGLLETYFDAKFAQGWDAAAVYPEGSGGNTIDAGHTYTTQAGTAVLKRLFSGLDPTSVIILESPVESVQQIPTPEGETITIKLRSWMAITV